MGQVSFLSITSRDVIYRAVFLKYRHELIHVYTIYRIRLEFIYNNTVILAILQIPQQHIQPIVSFTMDMPKIHLHHFPQSPYSTHNTVN